MMETPSIDPASSEEANDFSTDDTLRSDRLELEMKKDLEDFQPPDGAQLAVQPPRSIPTNSRRGQGGTYAGGDPTSGAASPELRAHVHEYLVRPTATDPEQQEPQPRNRMTKAERLVIQALEENGGTITVAALEQNRELGEELGRGLYAEDFMYEMSHRIQVIFDHETGVVQLPSDHQLPKTHES